MPESSSPNQFRQAQSLDDSNPKTTQATTKKTETVVTPNRLSLGPIAMGLGLLLILGGIALGISRNKEDVDKLPEYNAMYNGTSVPTAVQSPSPSAATNPSAVAVVEVSPTPVNQPATNPTSIIKTTKKVAAAVKPLPQFTPTSAAATNPSPSLPAYQPVVALPDYTPQHISPSPSPSPMTSVTLAAGGKNYSVSVRASATVYDVMQTASAQGFSFEVKDYSGLGKMVISINGVSQTGERFWTYTINGASASLGISSQTVKQGDVIVWTLSS